MPATGRPFALVTGASSGIGAALARELARDGYDLLLSARREAPMRALAAELETHGAAAGVVAADLSRPGAAAELVAAVEARGPPVEVLINNAGLGGVGRFDRIEPVRIGEMLNVNIIALTELTRLLVPGMIARRRGRIMLVGSTAGFVPGPGMAVYFATKAYVLSLGEALAQELRGTGVGVTTLCPGATATEFFEVAGSGHSVVPKMMSAAEVARIGYRGLKAGRRVVIAGLHNQVLAMGSRYAPHAVSLPVVAALMPRR
jgi:short-subunit dehydrogenase